MSSGKECGNTGEVSADVRAFCTYAAGAVITKETVMGWKKQLLQDGYAVCSINSMLASVNSRWVFSGGTIVK